MFFFLKPVFDFDSLPDSKILLWLLFFLFPRAEIVFKDDFEDDSFWEDYE